MLRHIGVKRTFEHNLRLAGLLSFTAGFTNVAGVLAFSVLTTNVTGHAATLALELSQGEFRTARMIALWLSLFLSGAFLSSLYVTIQGRQRRTVYIVPLLVEMSILLIVAIYGHTYDGSLSMKEVFAGSLLFAMGAQNALVSMISGSVVRTTHLTGMFTDLGIGLSEALVAKVVSKPLRNKLYLYLTIILVFLSGGMLGTYCFSAWSYHSFFVPAGLVLVILFYDAFRKSILLMKHHYTINHPGNRSR
ncbi:Uncharacterized membrane protein YoaK, UPF0700 family [bacterium A37T11]|nr:Uncharacterized membrane protein YoaK, UPF0700 family [bacterium A37T11]